MDSSYVDAETEALIAQLMAEDLGESYQSHSAPIGASYHDYEEPLSSYERQCLDAENNPDQEGEEGSGWGPEDSDGVNGTYAPVEGFKSTEPTAEGTWISRFVNEDGQVQEHITTEQSPPDGDDDESDSSSDSNGDSTDHSTRVVSLPAYSVPPNPAGEIRNMSAPTTLHTQPTPDVWPEPIPVPHDHLEPAEHPSLPESSIPPNPPPPNEALPASSRSAIEGLWDDGLDYSSHKGKGRAVRAYDEFKRGLRNSERKGRDLDVSDLDRDKEKDTDDDGGDEEIRDECLRFVRIPWPSPETDEFLCQREDANVVEIRVGDDETLESILRDISLREERRKKGKAAEGRAECVGEEVSERDDVRGRKVDATWW